MFSTNAPNPVSSVPATLTVTGAPNVTASPDTSDFGALRERRVHARTLVVTNDGTDAARDERRVVGRVALRGAFGVHGRAGARRRT